jgi:glutaredoxin
VKKFLFIVVLLAVAQNWGRIETLFLPTPDFSAIPAGHVVLYTTEWCPYCAKARHFFRARDIPYTEYDIEKSVDAKRQYHHLGGRGVPLILVGDRVIHGYDPKGVLRALAQ